MTSNTNEMNFKLLYLIDKKGFFLKMCEEFAELQESVLHHRDGKSSYEDVIDELADVYLQLIKIRWYLSGFDKEAHKLVTEHVLDRFKTKRKNLQDFINQLDDDYLNHAVGNRYS